jgi:hypothetical protein
MMMKYDNILLAALVLTLAACSGGSGSDPSSNNGHSTIPSDEAIADTSSLSTTEEASTSSLDLIAPDGFDFNATQEVQLQLNISSPAGEQAYVSVFTQYDAAKQMADYDTRVVMMPLPESKQLELNLNVPSYLDELWVEVWYSDKPESPIKTSVNIDSGVLLADL